MFFWRPSPPVAASLFQIEQSRTTTAAGSTDGGGDTAGEAPGAERIPELTAEFECHGVEHWARRTMCGRLGDAFPAQGVEWWIQYTGRTARSSVIGFNEKINYADISADLPNIRCPTLVITTQQSGLASVEHTRDWQQRIARSRLLVPAGNSYHAAASDAEACAKATLEFISGSVG